MELILYLCRNFHSASSGSMISIWHVEPDISGATTNRLRYGLAGLSMSTGSADSFSCRRFSMFSRLVAVPAGSPDASGAEATQSGEAAMSSPGDGSAGK